MPTSPRSWTRPLAVLLAAAPLLGVAEVARACGCAALPDGLIAAHPQSIPIAFAVRDAIDDGTFGPAPDIAKPGSAGSVLRLGGLHRWLTGELNAAAPATPPFALLLIGSGVTHAPGPKPGVIVVTHEAVLTAILDRRISFAVALDRGLLVLDGDPAVTASFRQALAG